MVGFWSSWDSLVGQHWWRMRLRRQEGDCLAGTVEMRGKFWRLKIRRQGPLTQTRTFDNRTEAQQWTRSIESDLDRDAVTDQRPPRAHHAGRSSGALPARCDADQGRRAGRESTAESHDAAPFVRIRMAALTSFHLAAYRDRPRLNQDSRRRSGNS